MNKEKGRKKKERGEGKRGVFSAADSRGRKKREESFRRRGTYIPAGGEEGGKKKGRWTRRSHVTLKPLSSRWMETEKKGEGEERSHFNPGFLFAASFGKKEGGRKERRKGQSSSFRQKPHPHSGGKEGEGERVPPSYSEKIRQKKRGGGEKGNDPLESTCVVPACVRRKGKKERNVFAIDLQGSHERSQEKKKKKGRRKSSSSYLSHCGVGMEKEREKYFPPLINRTERRGGRRGGRIILFPDHPPVEREGGGGESLNPSLTPGRRCRGGGRER